MDKQILIGAISSRLSQMGISAQYGNGADITVSTEFFDASGEVDNNKIGFQLSAFFDEAQQTLLYWECAKKVGGDLPFEGENESPFQPKAAQPLKIRRITYGQDGKAYEYELDVGEIAKAFMETARQYGWAFKSVINKPEAAYPDGYIPYAPLQNLKSASAPQKPQPTQSVERSPAQNKKGTGVLYWALFGLTSLITVIFCLAGNVSLLGWLLSAAVLIVMFVLGFKSIIKGPVASVIIWIIAGIMLFAVLGILTPSTGGGKAQADKMGDPAEAVFATSAIRSTIYASVYSKVENYESLYKPYADMSTFIDFQTVGSLSDENAQIAQISIDNMKVTSKPKKGNLTYYVDFSNPSADDSKFSTQSSYKMDFTDTTFIQSMSICLFIKVDDIKDYFKVQQAEVASDKVLGLVASWQDIKFTLEFDINATSKTGSVYSRHIVITMPQGDFMNDPNAQYYDVTYDLANDLAKAMLIKK